MADVAVHAVWTPALTNVDEGAIDELVDELVAGFVADAAGVGTRLMSTAAAPDSSGGFDDEAGTIALDLTLAGSPLNEESVEFVTSCARVKDELVALIQRSYMPADAPLVTVTFAVP